MYFVQALNETVCEKVYEPVNETVYDSGNSTA